MKVTIKFEGDEFEDLESLQCIMNARQLMSTIWDIRQEIRGRLKYADDVNEAEATFLERLQEMSYPDHPLDL